MIDDKTMQRLRAKLNKILPCNCGGNDYLNGKHYDDCFVSVQPKILQALAAEIERAEVEARLDELGVIMEMKPLTTVDSLLNLWGDRMSERKAELKSKTGGDNANRSDT
jgi:hypothetical protein